MDPSQLPQYLRHAGPIALAHRGWSTSGLENSAAAFSAPVELGYRYVETDVVATGDGVPLTFHDLVLDHVTDARGTVAEMSWRQVRAARIGGVEPVPRLDDVLAAFPGVRFNLDVKHSGAAAPLADAVRRTGARDRVLVASFSDRRRRAALAALGGGVATSASAPGAVRFRAAAWCGVRGAVLRRVVGDVHCLQLPVRFGPVSVVTERAVAAAHSAGLPVHAWTVDDPALMERLLDAGVDGLVTDRADTLREVLRRRGQWTA